MTDQISEPIFRVKQTCFGSSAPMLSSEASEALSTLRSVWEAFQIAVEETRSISTFFLPHLGPVSAHQGKCSHPTSGCQPRRGGGGNEDGMCRDLHSGIPDSPDP